MNPVDTTLLHRQQLLTQVNITTLPATATSDLGNNLSTQHSTAQIISGSIVVILFHPQPVTIVILLQQVTGRSSGGLLTGNIIGEGLSSIVGEITGCVIHQIHALVVCITRRERRVLSAPAFAISYVPPLVILITVGVRTVIEERHLFADREPRFIT